MIVYRITTEKYSNKLSASGVANRWNREEEYVIYASESRALTSLELVVHRASIRPRVNYKILVISIDVNKNQIFRLKPELLPKNWRSLQAYYQLQIIGTSWYNKQEKLIMQIPSAVIPKEHNFVINTKHALFQSRVSIKEIENFFWDDRLLN